MKKILFLVPVFFVVVTLFFFYPVFKGFIPYPGDLLTGAYEPYKSYSHLGYAPGGVPHKAQGPDVIRESVPWKFFVIESYKKGEIPFWTPYNFSGNAIMANFQSAVFYPLNGIFFLFPFSISWTIFIILSPFLAAFFTYLFLRELKLSIGASIFGGIVFAFSSYMVVWLQYGNITHTLLWLPLALLFTERLLKHVSIRDGLFLILSLSMAFLGGYIQGYFYLMVILGVYFVVKVFDDKKNVIKKIILFLFAIIFPLLLSSFQLLPTLELFTRSTRGNYSLDQLQQLLNPIWYMVTLVIPDFFGNPASRNFWFNGTYIERVSYFGIIPLVFAVVALFSSKRSKELKIFGFLFIFTFIISVDLFITKYLYTIPLPMLSTSVPTRVLSLFQFCGAILSAFAFQSFLQKKEKKTFLIAAISLFSLLMIVFVSTFSSARIFQNADWVTNMKIANRNTILPLLFSSLFVFLVLFQFSHRKFLMRFEKKKSIVIMIGIFVLILFDLFYFFHKITPFAPNEFLYPRTEIVSYLQNKAGFDRFWGYGNGYISSNFQTYDKTFSPDGDDPLQIRTYNQFLSSSENGRIPEVLTRLSVNLANGYGQEDLINNQYRQKVLNLLGIKYVLNKDESLGSEYRPDGAFDKNTYKLIWQSSPWQIYENKSVASRFFLTTDYIVISDEKKAIETFFKKDFNEKKTIILDQDPGIKKASLENTVVKVIDYQPNKILLEASSSADALLFLSDAYYPAWKAKVDGTPVKIYRADHAFRAVPISSGKHKVEFYYDSEFFKWGIIISISSAVLLLFIVLVVKFKRYE